MQYAGFDSGSGCRHAPKWEPIFKLTKDLQQEGRVTQPAKRVARAPSLPPPQQRDGTARRTTLRTDRRQPDRLEYSAIGGALGPIKRKGAAGGALDEGREGRPSQPSAIGDRKRDSASAGVEAEGRVGCPPQPVAAGDRKRSSESAGVVAESERRRPLQPEGSGSRKRGAEAAGVVVTEVRRQPVQPQGAGSSSDHGQLDETLYDACELDAGR